MKANPKKHSDKCLRSPSFRPVAKGRSSLFTALSSCTVSVRTLPPPQALYTEGWVFEQRFTCGLQKYTPRCAMGRCAQFDLSAYCGLPMPAVRLRQELHRINLGGHYGIKPFISFKRNADEPSHVHENSNDSRRIDSRVRAFRLCARRNERAADEFHGGHLHRFGPGQICTRYRRDDVRERQHRKRQGSQARRNRVHLGSRHRGNPRTHRRTPNAQPRHHHRRNAHEYGDSDRRRRLREASGRRCEGPQGQLRSPREVDRGRRSRSRRRRCRRRRLGHGGSSLLRATGRQGDRRRKELQHRRQRPRLRRLPRVP